MSSASLARMPWMRRLRARVFRVLHLTRINCRGPGHRIELNDSLLHRCKFEIQGKNQTLTIDPGARLWDVTLRLIGEANTCHIGAGTRLRGGHFLIEDCGGHLEIGSDTTMFEPMVVVSEGGRIRIGRDCLIAYGLDLRNSDGHSVLDAATRRRVNPPSDIAIGDHVWLGNNCQVLKGVTMGGHSIGAARSVITKDVPANSLVAGIPARVVREGVDWDHARLPAEPAVRSS